MKVHHVCSDPAYASVRCQPEDGRTDVDSLEADPIVDFFAPDCYLESGNEHVGNFIHISETALLLDDVVTDVMGDFLEAAGEMFPLYIHGLGKRYLLNVTENCNPVDRQRSTAASVDWRVAISEKRIEFHENRIYSFSSLFKIPDLQYRPILTFSEHTSHEHDFKAVYEENDLTGLVFDEMWSSN